MSSTNVRRKGAYSTKERWRKRKKYRGKRKQDSLSLNVLKNLFVSKDERFQRLGHGSLARSSLWPRIDLFTGLQRSTILTHSSFHEKLSWRQASVFGENKNVENIHPCWDVSVLSLFSVSSAWLVCHHHPSFSQLAPSCSVLQSSLASVFVVRLQVRASYHVVYKREWWTGKRDNTWKSYYLLAPHSQPRRQEPVKLENSFMRHI